MLPSTSLRRRALPALVAASALLPWAAAHAMSPGTVFPLEPGHHRTEMSVGAVGHVLSRFPSATTPRLALDIALHRMMDVGAHPDVVRLTAGVRFSPGGDAHLPLEGYSRVQLVAPLGAWRPALGPELGISGFTRLMRPPYADDLFDDREKRLSPFYVAVSAAPLRFQSGRFTLSAAEFQVGTSLLQPGGALRLQLGLLHLGGTL
jgi:hypothetical protein